LFPIALILRRSGQPWQCRNNSHATASCKLSAPPNPIYLNFVAENAPADRLTAARSRARGCLRYLNHGVVREFDSDRKEMHSAQVEAGPISLLGATPKYRLLERYVALNVNDEK
jgi:hypothetical protein